MTVKRRIAAHLKRERKSQSALARDLSISRSYLSLIVAGKRQPSLSVALRLEEATGIPARSFLKAA